jgi:4a-hydroxytetrahydrobiopterin dehydratase
MADRLSDSERIAALSALPDWQFETQPGSIRRAFKFADFPSAFAFMTRVAFIAEKSGHHPDWSNSYNRVVITLTTHDAGGVTAKDIAMAEAIDKVAV